MLPRLMESFKLLDYGVSFHEERVCEFLGVLTLIFGRYLRCFFGGTILVSWTDPAFLFKRRTLTPRLPKPSEKWSRKQWSTSMDF